MNGDRPHKSDQNLVQAIANFIYKLDGGILTLTVRNTNLQLLETEQVPVLLFAANFHHSLAEVPETERIQILPKIIGNWQNRDWRS